MRHRDLVGVLLDTTVPSAGAGSLPASCFRDRIAYLRSANADKSMRCEILFALRLRYTTVTHGSLPSVSSSENPRLAFLQQGERISSIGWPETMTDYEPVHVKDLSRIDHSGLIEEA